METPLRCHLLIGPPASGKTTLARALVPLLSQPGAPQALLLSTDEIRAEVFGDAAVQGPWSSIEALLHRRIIEAVAAGRPVLVDATHARRSWRLAITQALALPAPVEWIGWWLFTPLPTCLEWNRTRQRRVPVAVIQELAAALADRHHGPCRAEGFAAICSVVPGHHDRLTPMLEAELAALDRRIRAARSRENQHRLHGYSRLLDLERLLLLIRLLSSWPDLEASDGTSRQQLAAMVSPLPDGDLADRAAACLQRLHGACYGDSDAIRRDLAWLEANGFCHGSNKDGTVAPIQLAPVPEADGWPARGHGGHPSMGDAPVFVRVMTLLRHLLHHPFDHSDRSGENLHQHLITATAAIPGAYLPGETASLRKDIENLLTPYGFRPAGSSVRHGYCLGTAVLSAPRLLEIRSLVEQAAARLSDPSAGPLLAELNQRLDWASFSKDGPPPLRLYARHGVVDPALLRPGSLATAPGSAAIERAILQRQRVLLDRFSSAGTHKGSPQGEWRVWPLQLIFHNVGWYLCAEEDAIGRSAGLIRCERLDRLGLRAGCDGLHRGDDEHRRALQRLERLLHHCGGIHFGSDADAQLALAHGNASQRARQMETLRICCTPWAFAFLREGMGRYPREQIRYSRPLPGDSWWRHRLAPHVLEPLAAGDSHPYPIELDLPRWTLAGDIDLRNWLFGFGSGIRIEAPAALRAEWLQRCRAVLAAHGDTEELQHGGRDADSDDPEHGHEAHPEPPH